MAAVLCGFAASVDGSPYDGIPDRNLFGLQAPPRSFVDNPTPTPAIPKITLTGITTILGRKLAFVTIGDAKRGQPSEFLMLAEGQSADGFEVKEIDEKGGCVRLTSHGQGMALDFVDVR